MKRMTPIVHSRRACSRQHASRRLGPGLASRSLELGLGLGLALLASACGADDSPPAVLGASVHMDALLAADTRTLSVFVFGPKRTDQKLLTCNNLQLMVLTSTDPRLEQLARVDIAFTDPAGREARLERVAAGTGRVVFAEALGVNDTYLANGCVEGVSVGSGATVNVAVMMYPPRR